MKNITLIILVSIFLFSCNKPENENQDIDNSPETEYGKMFDDYAIFPENTVRIYMDSINNFTDTIIYKDTDIVYITGELHHVNIKYTSSFMNQQTLDVLLNLDNNNNIWELLGNNYMNSATDTSQQVMGRFLEEIQSYTINGIEYNNVRKYVLNNPSEHKLVCYWAKNIGVIEKTEYRNNDTLFWYLKEL